MIEDDGVTYDYLDGGFAYTKINVRNSNINGFDLVLCERQGEFNGRNYDVNNSVYIDKSAPMSSYNDNVAGIYADKISGMQEVTDFDVNIFVNEPLKSITLNNENVSFTYDVKNIARFFVPMKEHEGKTLTYTIQL